MVPTIESEGTMKKLWMFPFLAYIFLYLGMWLGRSGAGLFIGATSQALGVPL